MRFRKTLISIALALLFIMAGWVGHKGWVKFTGVQGKLDALEQNMDRMDVRLRVLEKLEERK